MHIHCSRHRGSFGSWSNDVTLMRGLQRLRRSEVGGCGRSRAGRGPIDAALLQRAERAGHRPSTSFIRAETDATATEDQDRGSPEHHEPVAGSGHGLKRRALTLSNLHFLTQQQFSGTPQDPRQVDAGGEEPKKPGLSQGEKGRNTRLENETLAPTPGTRRENQVETNGNRSTAGNPAKTALHRSRGSVSHPRYLSLRERSPQRHTKSTPLMVDDA